MACLYDLPEDSIMFSLIRIIVYNLNGICYAKDMLRWLDMRIVLFSFRLWYLYLTSIMVRYHAFVSLGSISFSVGPLCSGYMNRHNLTLPFGLGTVIKLLHHSAFSSTYSGASICCSCSHSKCITSFSEGCMLCISRALGMPLDHL